MMRNSLGVKIILCEGKIVVIHFSVALVKISYKPKHNTSEQQNVCLSRNLTVTKTTHCCTYEIVLNARDE